MTMAREPRSDRAGPADDGAFPAALPEIAVQKKKDEEKDRKGGAILVGPGSAGQSGGFLFRLFGLGSPGAGGLAGAGAGAELGAAAEASGVWSFLTSNAGLALMTALLSGAAVFGFLAVQHESTERGPSELAFPSAQAPSAAPSAGREGGAISDSVGMFSMANKGRAGPAAADAAAAAAAQAAPDKKSAPQPAIPPANAGAVVAAAKAAAHGAAPSPQTAKMIASAGLGSGNGLAGGSGMSGGFSQKFSKTASSKALQNFSKPVTDKGQAGRKMTPITLSKSMDQLRFAKQQSVSASSQGTAEGRAEGSTSAFEGLGFTNGARPPASPASVPDVSPGSNPNEGGPILGQNSTEDPQAPPPGSSSDKSPWTAALMMGVALLGTASTIILIEGILVDMEPETFGMTEPIAQALAAMAAALAASAAAIGGMIMAKYGQMQQGLALTIGGSITTAAAIAALMMGSAEGASMPLVLGGIAGLIASMLAMISGAMANKVK
ncbi:MAG TPA: hypothetical protein VNI01_02265 [Elusimicrobiota bacterium]|jgi:hypothetical protein|nr:hypothetical protein [Elusimicrobiota bacterium]